MELQFIKIRDVKTPSRANTTDAGIDFFIPDDLSGKLTVVPNHKIEIPSGLKMVIPQGYAGIFKNKSSIGAKGLLLGPCVVDSDYRGEVKIVLWNVSDKTITLKPGQKITQMLMQRIPMMGIYQITDELFEQYDNTKRGSGGFGSTGE